MDTRVKILGCTFENPLLPASGPLVEGYENLVSLKDLGLGGLVTKTISVEGAQVTKPCIVGTKHLLYNAELWSELPLSYWMEALGRFSALKDSPLGISVGYTVAELQTVVPALTAYADFFEVSTHYGREGLPELVEAMTALTDKPVLIKLSPHVADDLGFVETALSHGAAGIVALNSFGPGLALSLKHRSVAIGNSAGHAWVSGPAIKPFVLERIARLRSAFPDMVLVGCGGVDTAEDALEMVMAGADLVQVLSSALLRGRGHYQHLVQNLPRAMAENHIESIGALRAEGFSRAFTAARDAVDFPLVNASLCNGCQLCVRVCPFMAYSSGVTAPTVNPISTLKVPVVNPARCRQCGLCESLCPKGAISGVFNRP